MQIALKRIGSQEPAVTITWDQELSLVNMPPPWPIEHRKLLAQINKVCELGIQEGSLPLTPTWDYPIKKPLNDPLEFAVVLLFLDWYSDDLPLPEVSSLTSDVEVIY